MATYYNTFYDSNAMDILAAYKKKSEEFDKEFDRRMSIIEGKLPGLQSANSHPVNEVIDSLTPSPKLSQVQRNTVMLESVAEIGSAYAGDEDDYYDVNGNSSSESGRIVSASTEPDLNSENIKSVSVDVTDESDKVENTMKIVSTDVVDWNDTLGFANSVCVLNCNRCKCSSVVCQNASMDWSSYFITNRICITSRCSPPPVQHTPVGFKSVLVLKVDDIGLKSKGFKSGTVVSSLNLCTKLVRQNVCEMFPLLLPPAKPPENILLCVPRNGRVWFVVATAYSDKELYYVMLQSPNDVASREGMFEQLRSGTMLYSLAGATMADYKSGKLLWRLFLLLMLVNMVSTSAGDGFIVVGLKTIKFDENNMLTASLDGAKVVLNFYKRYFLQKFIAPEAYVIGDVQVERTEEEINAVIIMYCSDAQADIKNLVDEISFNLKAFNEFKLAGTEEEINGDEQSVRKLSVYLKDTVVPKFIQDLCTREVSPMGAKAQLSSMSLGQLMRGEEDHQPVRTILTQIVHTPEQKKWVSKLMRFDFEVEYKPGKENGPAGALSRWLEATYMAVQGLSKPVCDLLRALRTLCLTHPVMQELVRQVRGEPELYEHYAIRDGLLLFKGRLFVPPDPGIKDLILHEYHDSPVGGYIVIMVVVDVNSGLVVSEFEEVYDRPPPTLWDYVAGTSNVGAMAYKLALPANSKVHKVLHLPKMKCCNVIQPFVVTWPEEFSGSRPVLQPHKVLGRRVWVRGAEGVTQVHVQWVGHSVADATWEDWDQFVLDCAAYNLEDEVETEGGQVDTDEVGAGHVRGGGCIIIVRHVRCDGVTSCVTSLWVGV